MAELRPPKGSSKPVRGRQPKGSLEDGFSVVSLESAPSSVPSRSTADNLLGAKTLPDADTRNSYFSVNQNRLAQFDTCGKPDQSPSKADG